MSSLIKRGRRKENKGKHPLSSRNGTNFWCSERRIEQLKSHFEDKDITLLTKWKDIEELLKDDPIWSSSEPLEQIM